MQQQAIKNIVIVGGGTAGWMTAAAFSKILGVANHNITLVESEMIGTVGVGEATIPMIMLFNSVLGLDEDEFVRETNATFKLGIEFVDWKKIGSSYIHPFGLFGVDMDGIPFTHFWLRHLKNGGNPDAGRFNVETEAARKNKFARSGEQKGPMVMPKVNYAFQFDASLYAAYLRRYAEARGVVRSEGMIVKVNQDAQSGYVESVEMKDGRVVKGDLFIDCSGFRGLLIEETFKTGYNDWTKWLPANRAAAMPCAKVEEPVPYTRATAREAGWQWRIPLQHRTGNGYVFSSEFISEDEAMMKLKSRIDGAPQAEPRLLKFVTGMRKKCWVKNVVAIGLASGFLEPLESTSIHLGQVAIAKLLAMFPNYGFDERLIARFNREMDDEYTNVKDFLIAHYHVTEREDTPFWRYCKNMDIPDSLTEKLHVFKTRGEVLPTLYDLFKEQSWFAVLYGQGITPEGYHPVADTISDDDLKLRLSKIRTGIQDRLNTMPSHQDFIDKNCRAAM